MSVASVVSNRALGPSLAVLVVLGLSCTWTWRHEGNQPIRMGLDAYYYMSHGETAAHRGGRHTSVFVLMDILGGMGLPPEKAYTAAGLLLFATLGAAVGALVFQAGARITGTALAVLVVSVCDSVYLLRVEFVGQLCATACVLAALAVWNGTRARSVRMLACVVLSVVGLGAHALFAPILAGSAFAIWWCRRHPGLSGVWPLLKGAICLAALGGILIVVLFRFGVPPPRLRAMVTPVPFLAWGRSTALEGQALTAIALVALYVRRQSTDEVPAVVLACASLGASVLLNPFVYLSSGLNGAGERVALTMVPFSVVVLAAQVRRRSEAAIVRTVAIAVAAAAVVAATSLPRPVLDSLTGEAARRRRESLVRFVEELQLRSDDIVFASKGEEHAIAFLSRAKSMRPVHASEAERAKGWFLLYHPQQCDLLGASQGHENEWSLVPEKCEAHRLSGWNADCLRAFNSEVWPWLKRVDNDNGNQPD